MPVRPPYEDPGINSPFEVPEQEKLLTQRVVADAQHFENTIGTDFHARCNKYYDQYRSFNRFKGDWIKAGPRDKDGLLLDAKKEWGANLHIPLSYRTIETMVPRAIAHRPKLLVLPRTPQWAPNVQSVRLLIDAQQDNISIDLPFQAVMRTGRIYGIGFGKAFWETRYSTAMTVQPRTREVRGQSPYYVQEQRRKVFDDPMFEDLDVFDVMWDPYGSSFHGPGRCRWVIHRLWLNLDDILERVRTGAWSTQGAQRLAGPGGEETLRAIGMGQKYDEVWADRMAASGFGNVQNYARGEQIHEVWEWHDGERVLTVLDRCLLVQDAINPIPGMLPFSAYRPTPLQKQMVGIGDLEPLEHLQRELDTLRSQRRDAATIALAAGYVFDENMIDVDDLDWGPHVAIPVINGRPSDAIFPIPARDVPGSGYQEESVIRADIDAVSGINDALDPSQGGAVSTATEAQLVQAALSRRIELGARRFEIEVVRQVARQFLALNQRMIIDDSRNPIRQPDEGLDEQQAAMEGRWKWFQVGPMELRGEFEIVPEGGSMAARNVAQDRQDAQLFMSLTQNPHIDAKRPLLKALELLGVQDTEAWLRQQAPPVPPLALQNLEKAGVPRNIIQLAVALAQQQDPQLAPDQQQGPNVQQVDQAMGVQG